MSLLPMTIAALVVAVPPIRPYRAESMAEMPERRGCCNVAEAATLGRGASAKGIYIRAFLPK